MWLAQEAGALKRLIEAASLEAHPFKGLAPAFFADSRSCWPRRGPWRRAISFFRRRAGSARMISPTPELQLRVAAPRLEDATVHRIVSEVSHLARPSSALRDPQIVDRVTALMNGSA